MEKNRKLSHKNFFWFLVTVLIIPTCYSQTSIRLEMGNCIYRGEVGANIVRDINFVDFNPKASRPSFSINFIKSLSDNLTINITGGYSRIYGSDLFSRQKEFVSRNYEICGSITDFGIETNIGISQNIPFYFIGGIKGIINTYSLNNREYKNENLSKTSNNFSVSVPFGLGLKIAKINKNMLTFEIKTNAVLDDNLDGLSLVNSRSTDYYTTMLMGVSIPINHKITKSRIKHINKYGIINTGFARKGECPGF